MTIPNLLIPRELQAAAAARGAQWREQRGTARLFEKDATLWTGDGEQRWLGWLDSMTAQRAAIPRLDRFSAAVAREWIRDVTVLGMGGSSLCPFVLASTFGHVAGRPRLHVLDSTDPDQIQTLEAKLDLPNALFVVSSKSGSTLEPNILRDYFLHRMRDVVGDKAGQHFVAVTDPGSQLESQARADGFREIFLGDPEIGGRFSALSPFGTVPGALAGVDLARFLTSAQQMARACRRDDPAHNPGVGLGITMAEAAIAGRDKLTIFSSPGISEIGAWLDQLIAESTGKRGKGIIPVAGEALGPPDSYGRDRLFVHLRLAGEPDPQDPAVRALADAGLPVIQVDVPDRYELGGEFYRWEVATAVAGAVLGINPFDQPDVEASKIATRQLTDAVEKTGSLPAEEPFHDERGIMLFADPANTSDLEKNVTQRTLTEFVRAHLKRLGAGDYAAILAYVEMSDANLQPLVSMRQAIGGASNVATTLGFGPRFLHSTGQLHKGGPNSGLFLQITGEAVQDLPVPGRRYSFGTVKAAQARGDFAVLAERGRRALRVHLSDVKAGLGTLDSVIRQAVS